MYEYKVDALVYYTKLTTDKEHLVKSSQADIQEKLNERSGEGWRLVSTDATDFGFAVYVYLYFEREARG
jgi:hypothetical protein